MQSNPAITISGYYEILWIANIFRVPGLGKVSFNSDLFNMQTSSSYNEVRLYAARIRTSMELRFQDYHSWESMPFQGELCDSNQKRITFARKSSEICSTSFEQKQSARKKFCSTSSILSENRTQDAFSTQREWRRKLEVSKKLKFCVFVSMQHHTSGSGSTHSSEELYSRRSLKFLSPS